MKYLKILCQANSLIANNCIRSVILENKTTNEKSLNTNISFSFRQHFQSKCSRERERNISILTILHLLGIVGIVSARSKSLSASLKKMKLADIGLQYEFF